jgi:hypothetical protein
MAHWEEDDARKLVSDLLAKWSDSAFVQAEPHVLLRAVRPLAVMMMPPPWFATRRQRA